MCRLDTARNGKKGRGWVVLTLNSMQAYDKPNKTVVIITFFPVPVLISIPSYN